MIVKIAHPSEMGQILELCLSLCGSKGLHGLCGRSGCHPKRSFSL